MDSMKKSSTIQLSEHVSEAEQMAQSIIEKYDPDQQNEMVRHIRQVVSEHRQSKMEEAEKHLSYLKETFESL